MSISEDITYSLSQPQNRIYYIEKVYLDTAINNIGGFIKIKGKLNFDLLEKSIQQFIFCNEGLRLELVEIDNQIKQYVKEYTSIEVPFYDFSRSENSIETAYLWMQSQFQKPFKLLKNSLFEFALIKLSEDVNGFFVKFHHIIADGWTIQLMTEQITSNYIQLKLGNKDVTDNKSSYIEYLKNEEDYFQSNRFYKDKIFWENTFSELPDVYLQKSFENLQGARKKFKISTYQTELIRNFATQANISLNTLFISVLMIYLNKILQQTDIIIGNPVLNRTSYKQKNTVGMFTSTMPFRMKIDGTLGLEDFIREVNMEIKQHFIHQKYPYNFIIDNIDLYDKGKRNLFQVVLNYYNTKLVTDMDGLEIENEEFYCGSQLNSLQIVIKDWSSTNEIELQFDHKISDFTEEDIKRVYQHFMSILDYFLINYPESINKIQLMSKSDTKNLLYQYNATSSTYPNNQTILQLFEKQVMKTPDNIAISVDKQQFSYNEINKKSNQLARELIARGVMHNDYVGIMVEHSVETIISIFAILKAGAVYIPIDPNYPLQRIEYIINDSKLKVVLTNIELEYFPSVDIELIHFDIQDNYSIDDNNLNIIVSPNDPVYVIYTSGSTGTPKGTIIHHQGLVNYIWWAKNIYISDSKDVFALYSSIAFDLTVTTIFTPLICGNKIKVYRDINDEFILHHILRKNEVTVIKLTPAHLSLIKDLDNSHSSVKKLIVGGEDLKSQLAFEIMQSFNKTIEIYNEYGPTETVVGCMIHKYNSEKDIRASVPIGKPIDNVQVYILDKNLLPTPIGIDGEIYISGDGVGIGYLNHPELTNKHFIKNPFLSGKLMYRTGDLAAFLNNENIEYKGRIDTQVKIKGYRIELSEIENQLLQIDGVLNAVVFDQPEVANEKLLTAYVKIVPSITLFKVKEILTNKLPSYMIPAYFVHLDNFPLSVNGKIDRKAMPLPSSINSTIRSSNEFIENLLLTVLKEIFAKEAITLEDNFYHLGGDSIKAIQIVSKLKGYNLNLQVKDILNYPLFKELSYLIETKELKSIEQEQTNGLVPLTPIIEWFFEQKLNNPHHWNQSILIDLHVDISIKSINSIFLKIVSHHDALRLQYKAKENILHYVNNNYKNFKIETQDLSFYSEENQIKKIKEIGYSSKSSMNIENSLLFKAVLFNLGNQKKKILLTAHHLIIDTVSWHVILDDLKNLMIQIEEPSELLTLPHKTESFKTWSEALHNYSNTNTLQSEMIYWNSQVVSESLLGKFFTHEKIYKIENDYKMKSMQLELNVKETKQLFTIANMAYKTESMDLLITSLCKSLYEFTGVNELTLELEGHGREDLLNEIDISRTVGWFTTLYPFTTIFEESSLSTEIKSMKEKLRKIPKKGIGYGILTHLSKKLKVNNNKLIRFNYLGDFNDNIGSPYFTLSDMDSGSEQSISNCPTSLFEIIVFKINEKLQVRVSYSSLQINEDILYKFMNIFMDKLKDIISHCSTKEDTEVTPTDFETISLGQDELDFLLS